MNLISLIAVIVNWLLLLYFLTLLARLVLGYVRAFNRSWRPEGAALVAAEIVFMVTDPPIRFFQRFIRPVRLGPVAIDFAFTVTLLLCLVLISVTRVFIV